MADLISAAVRRQMDGCGCSAKRAGAFPVRQSPSSTSPLLSCTKCLAISSCGGRCAALVRNPRRAAADNSSAQHHRRPQIVFPGAFSGRHSSELYLSPSARKSSPVVYTTAGTKALYKQPRGRLKSLDERKKETALSE